MNATNKYWITNETAVDFAMKIKVGELSWLEGSDRPDDAGSIYVAPVSFAKWEAPLGLVMVYATTNGDPVALAQIEDGEITWFEESNQNPGLEAVRPLLEKARWIHPSDVEGYSYLIMESL